MPLFRLHTLGKKELLKCLSCACCGLIALVQSVAVAAEPPESFDDIKILLNDWTSQLVLAKVTGSIFEDMGYGVSYVTKTSNAQWGSLKMGLSHVQVEVWEGTMAKMFDRMIAADAIIDAGSHQAKTREDWWYPTYVEDLCPGLPDWRALKKCSAIFATKETAPRGRYLGGPWEKPDAARIRALDLGFKAINVKNGDALWVALDEAYKKREAIVLFNWTPNWVEAKYEGKFVEFPEYHQRCEKDPKWGINKDFLHDCGNPKNGWLKKVAWSGMPEKWPCAFATLENISFSNVMIAELSVMVDVEKMTHEVVAKLWLEKNQSTWRAWIPKECTP